MGEAPARSDLTDAPHIHTYTPTHNAVEPGKLKTEYPIIIGGDNFGCGSSREVRTCGCAVWGLDMRVRVYAYIGSRGVTNRIINHQAHTHRISTTYNLIQSPHSTPPSPSAPPARALLWPSRTRASSSATASPRASATPTSARASASARRSRRAMRCVVWILGGSQVSGGDWVWGERGVELVLSSKVSDPNRTGQTQPPKNR